MEIREIYSLLRENATVPSVLSLLLVILLLLSCQRDSVLELD